MSCTRVLHALGSRPQPAVMPVDLAVCLSLSQRQPLYQLLSMSPRNTLQRHRSLPSNSLPRPRLRSPHSASSLQYSSSSSPSSSPSSSSSSSPSSSPSSSLSSSPPSSPPSSLVPSEPLSCFRRDGGCLNKKRVVFADTKGLALTAVRLFIPEPSSPDPTLLMKPTTAKLQGQPLTSNKLQRYKLRLGFTQPKLDFKAFLARLQEVCVQLESCSVSEHSLSGKVCVSHASTEKVVHVRVTFDSWRSHHDIPCTFLQQQRYGGSDMDVFAFDLSLPKNIDPKERVEFCVAFRPGPGAAPHWDDNRGQNYRVCMEKDGSSANQSANQSANRFYPTLSKHRPPSWSFNMQNSADLQYLQRSLSSSHNRLENSVFS